MSRWVFSTGLFFVSDQGIPAAIVSLPKRDFWKPSIKLMPMRNITAGPKHNVQNTSLFESVNSGKLDTNGFRGHTGVRGIVIAQLSIRKSS